VTPASAASAPDDPGARDVRRYLGHLRVERGLAPRTLEAYGRDLAAWTRHLADRGVDGPADAAAADVTSFLAASSHLAPRTVARRLAAVRGLQRFLVSEGRAPTDPTADVPAPSVPLRLPEALGPDEVRRLLEAASVPTGARRPEAAALRDRALLELLYGTGARISEAVGLDVDDLAVADRALRLLGKGDKERVVPLGGYALEALDAYLVRARPELARAGRGNPALFLNQRGTRLTRQGAFGILTAAAERAGLTARVSPHTLRHSYATHLLSGGADVRVVQELLGHASVTTTQVYTHVTIDALREVYATAHPRARGGRGGALR
jgi:integrase/recombinase XerD